jgi:hypothetical protein
MPAVVGGQDLPEQFLGFSTGVYVGGVYVVDSQLEGLFYDVLGIVQLDLVGKGQPGSVCDFTYL